MSTATLEKVSQLDQLKKFTKVVADTGDFESMRAYQPYDADDESEPDFCRHPKVGIRLSFREGDRRSKGFGPEHLREDRGNH